MNDDRKPSEILRALWEEYGAPRFIAGYYWLPCARCGCAVGNLVVALRPESADALIGRGAGDTRTWCDKLAQMCAGLDYYQAVVLDDVYEDAYAAACRGWDSENPQVQSIEAIDAAGAIAERGEAEVVFALGRAVEASIGYLEGLGL